MPMSPAAQRRRVVHAVADDRDLVALDLHGADKFHLVLRQTVALRFLAADLRSNARGHGLTVAGNHRDAAHAGVFKSASASPLRARLVLQADPADAMPVSRDKNQTPALGLVEVNGLFKTRRHAVVLSHCARPDQNGCTVNVRLHATAGGLGKILRLGQRHAGFAREFRERLGGRMVAVFFGGGGKAAAVRRAWFRRSALGG